MKNQNTGEKSPFLSSFFTGNLPSKELNTQKNANNTEQAAGREMVEMNDEKRIYFEENEIRKQFFNEVRNVYNAKSWRELAKRLELHRTFFQKYQYGQNTIPFSLFNRLISKLEKEKQEYFLENISKKDANWGRIKGGKTTANKYPEEFARRREKGLQKMREISKSKAEKHAKRKCVKINEIGLKAATKKYRKEFARIKEELQKAIKTYEVIRCFDIDQPLSEKTCEFVGSLIGDGFIAKYGKHNYVIEVVGDKRLDKEYIKYLAKNIEESFKSVKARFYELNHKNVFRVRFHSKKLFEFLRYGFNFPIGKKTYIIKIPERIMELENEFIFATIRGIFDTDGCVFFDKRKSYRTAYPRITFITASEPLFWQLKEFLANFFTLYAANKSKESTPRFEITIYGKKQIKKWMELIGFSNERHLSKIKTLEPGEGFEPST